MTRNEHEDHLIQSKKSKLSIQGDLNKNDESMAAENYIAKDMDLKLLESSLELKKIVEPENLPVVKEAPAEGISSSQGSCLSLEDRLEMMDKEMLEGEEDQSINSTKVFIQEIKNIPKQNILDEKTLSEENSLSEEEYSSSSIINKETQPEDEWMFFDNFGQVPEIDELSLDLTEDLSAQQLIDSESQFQELGKFVGALEGSPISRSTQSVGSKTSDILNLKEFGMEASKTEKIEEKEDLSLVDDISKEILGDSADVVNQVRKSSKTKETYLLLLDTLKDHEKPVQFEDEIEKAKAELKEQKERAIQDNVTEFLNRLIRLCVAKAEYSNGAKVLRRSLDKRKLINELKSKYDLLMRERKESQFLNKKTVEYLKRKNNFRLLIADESKNLPVDRNKFHETLHDLDKWLSREQKAKAFNSSQVEKLREQFEKVKQQAEKEVENLEELLKTTIQQNVFGKSPITINKYLNHMSAIRQQISQVRLTLLLKQHEFSSLKQQMQQLDDLGNGLTVHQFEALETETTAMSKKIEEYNSTLKRCQNHFTEDVHKMAHLREKHKILRNIIVTQKQYLAELLQQKKQQREYINQMKLKKIRRRYEMGELINQSGLLSKPALIRDYDEMTEKANKLRQTNEELRITAQELETKIAILEKSSTA